MLLHTMTPHSLPENRGFDRSTVVRTHIDSYWKVLAGCDIYRDGEIFIKGDNEKANLKILTGQIRDFYTTDFFTDVAIEYMEDALAVKKTPFLYLAYNAPHFPLEAPDEITAEYEVNFEDAEWLATWGSGWDNMRQKARQAEGTWCCSSATAASHCELIS